jgi:hypothetical protein
MAVVHRDEEGSVHLLLTSQGNPNMSQLSGQTAGHSADPLEETQENPDLPRLLGIRAARALSNLNPHTAPRIDASAESRAARAAMIYAIVIVAVIAAVAASVAALPHAGT